MRGTLIKLVLTMVIGALMMLGIQQWIVPTSRIPKHQAILNSYSTPIKVIAVHGKRYQFIAFFEDEKRQRGVAIISEQDPVIVGDEIELYLDWANDTCARRKIK